MRALVSRGRARARAHRPLARARRPPTARGGARRHAAARGDARARLLVGEHVPHAVAREDDELVAPGRERGVGDLRVAGAPDRRGHEVAERAREQQPRRGRLLQPHARLANEAPARQALGLHARARGLDALALGQPPGAVVDRQRLRPELPRVGRRALAQDHAAVACGRDPQAVAQLERDGRRRAAVREVHARLRRGGGGGVDDCSAGACAPRALHRAGGQPAARPPPPTPHPPPGRTPPPPRCAAPA